MNIKLHEPLCVRKHHSMSRGREKSFPGRILYSRNDPHMQKSLRSKAKKERREVSNPHPHHTTPSKSTTQPQIIFLAPHLYRRGDLDTSIATDQTDRANRLASNNMEAVVRSRGGGNVDEVVVRRGAIVIGEESV